MQLLIWSKTYNRLGWQQMEWLTLSDKNIMVMKKELQRKRLHNQKITS